jgi:hypothetical protein
VKLGHFVPYFLFVLSIGFILNVNNTKVCEWQHYLLCYPIQKAVRKEELDKERERERDQMDVL